MDIQPAIYDQSIAYTAHKKEEIQKAIIQLKQGKAAGPGNIQAEVLLVDVETSAEMVH